LRNEEEGVDFDIEEFERMVAADQIPGTSTNKTLEAVTSNIQKRADDFRKTMSKFGGTPDDDEAAVGTMAAHTERVEELTAEIE
jgi:predicted lactoylglutathione lyase